MSLSKWMKSRRRIWGKIIEIAEYRLRQFRTEGGGEKHRTILGLHYHNFFMSGELLSDDCTNFNVSRRGIPCESTTWQWVQNSCCVGFRITLPKNGRSRFLGRGSDEALFSEKRGFQWEGGRDSVNEGFGKDFYRKGNSVKRSGPLSELPDFENWKVAVLIHFPKISS